MGGVTKPQGIIKSDETLFAIIEAIRDLDGAGVTELADHLDMAKSAVHKHLKTLDYHGYVVKRENAYHLSFKFLTLGGYVQDSNELCRLAGPKVKELANDLEVVSTFTIEENGQGVVVHQSNELSVDVRLYPGMEVYLHQTAAGKAILAEMSDEDVREVIDRVGLPAATGNTITTAGELFEELEEIRERGFAITVEESAEGAAGVGVAIEDEATGTIGAIAIACGVTEMAIQKFETEYADRLFETASEIRYQLRS